MQLFWTRGYRAMTVDELVEATGVKPGSLYKAFSGGKGALLAEALGRYSNLVVPEKLGALDGPDASLAEVRGYFEGLVRDLLSDEGRRGCLLVNSAIELAAEDDAVAAVVRGHHARLERRFADALQTAKERGEVPRTIDPAGKARLLMATSQGLMVVGKANPNREVLEAIVDNAFADLA